jgi:hypothetical protein
MGKTGESVVTGKTDGAATMDRMRPGTQAERMAALVVMAAMPVREQMDHLVGRVDASM